MNDPVCPPTDAVDRRSFLIRSAAGLSAAWLTSQWPAMVSAATHAHAAVATPNPAKFEFFTPEEAADVEAIASRIIPSDETPGAKEAGVIYFIDRALKTFAAPDSAAMVKGLKQLPGQVKKRSKTTQKFSELSSEQQIALLKTIEKSPFFELVRMLTITGMFANAEYGGNYNQIGWKLIGFEDKFFFEPPFGFYDGEAQTK